MTNKFKGISVSTNEKILTFLVNFTLVMCVVIFVLAMIVGLPRDYVSLRTQWQSPDHAMTVIVDSLMSPKRCELRLGDEMLYTPTLVFNSEPGFDNTVSAFVDGMQAMKTSFMYDDEIQNIDSYTRYFAQWFWIDEDLEKLKNHDSLTINTVNPHDDMEQSSRISLKYIKDAIFELDRCFLSLEE